MSLNMTLLHIITIVKDAPPPLLRHHSMTRWHEDAHAVMLLNRAVGNSPFTALANRPDIVASLAESINTCDQLKTGTYGHWDLGPFAIISPDEIDTRPKLEKMILQVSPDFLSHIFWKQSRKLADDLSSLKRHL